MMSTMMLGASELWSMMLAMMTIVSSLVIESHWWWASSEWGFLLEPIHHLFHFVHHGVNFILVREFHLEMHWLTIDVGVKSECIVRPEWILSLLKVSSTLGVVAIALVEETVEFSEFGNDKVMQDHNSKTREIILLEGFSGVLGLLLLDSLHGHLTHEEDDSKGDEAYKAEISNDVVHVEFELEKVTLVSSVSLSDLSDEEISSWIRQKESKEAENHSHNTSDLHDHG